MSSLFKTDIYLRKTSSIRNDAYQELKFSWREDFIVVSNFVQCHTMRNLKYYGGNSYEVCLQTMKYYYLP